MTKFPINPKNPIFGPFAPFLRQEKFFLVKSGSVTHSNTQHISLKHHTEFQKKQMSQSIPRKLTIGQKGQRTEGKKDRRMVRP